MMFLVVSGTKTSSVAAGDHAVESWRRHADDGERMRIDQQRLIDHARIGAELALPVVEAEHHHRAAVGHIVGGDEKPSHRRLQPERLEIVAGGQLAADQIRLVVPLHADVLQVAGDQALEDAALVAQIAVHRVGEVVVIVAAEGVEVAASRAGELQPRTSCSGWLTGKGAQQRLVEQGEDGGVSADAQRQSDDGN